MTNNMKLKLIPAVMAMLLTMVSVPTWSDNQSTGTGVLTGQYGITGATVVDPPEGEEGNTRFRIHLTGNAAEDLYRSMNVKPVDDICLDDGSVSKMIGNMQCTYLKKTGQYECRFSIDVAKQKIDYGWAC